MELVLSPCEERAHAGRREDPLAELGRELLGEAVRRALGIDPAEDETGAGAA
jgi:hypothetical protein